MKSFFIYMSQNKSHQKCTDATTGTMEDVIKQLGQLRASIEDLRRVFSDVLSDEEYTEDDEDQPELSDK